jgi:hypothetical protein
VAHEVTSTPIKHLTTTMAAPDARCTAPRVTMQVSARRSRSLRNSSVKSSCSRVKMAHLPASGGQTKVDPKEEKDEEMEFQNTKKVLKAMYGHSDSESSNNKHRKALHVVFMAS